MLRLAPPQWRNFYLTIFFAILINSRQTRSQWSGFQAVYTGNYKLEKTHITCIKIIHKPFFEFIVNMYCIHTIKCHKTAKVTKFNKTHKFIRSFIKALISSTNLDFIMVKSSFVFTFTFCCKTWNSPSSSTWQYIIHQHHTALQRAILSSRPNVLIVYV